jgi:hypothetical protein
MIELKSGSYYRPGPLSEAASGHITAIITSIGRTGKQAFIIHAARYCGYLNKCK